MKETTTKIRNYNRELCAGMEPSIYPHGRRAQDYGMAPNPGNKGGFLEEMRPGGLVWHGAEGYSRQRIACAKTQSKQSPTPVMPTSVFLLRC